MKLTNGERAKIVIRDTTDDKEKCDFCGKSIDTHNGEFVIYTESQNFIGFDHLTEVQA